MMTTFRAIFVIVPLCVLPSLSQAQETSCGTWVSGRKEKSIVADVLKAWAVGFMSGANVSAGNKDWLKDIDGDAIHAWLDNRCGKDPSMRFSDAVLALMQELRTR